MDSETNCFCLLKSFSFKSNFELSPILDEHIRETDHKGIVNAFVKATDCYYGNIEFVWHLVFPLFSVAIVMKPWVLTPFQILLT